MLRTIRSRFLHLTALIGFSLSAINAAPAAAAPVVFSKQVLPLLKSQCWACHSGASPASGFSMESRDRLLSGGRHGAAIQVGKGGQSSLVQYMTGALKPKMPPNGAIDMETIGVIRRWIDEGAKVDSMTVTGSAAVAKPGGRQIPDPHALVQAAPVTALAFSPDGAALAAGGYRVVRLLDPKSGAVLRTLSGPADQVQAVAWSSDGKLLAAAGGVPGVSGEVVVLDVQTGKVVSTLSGHSEVVYAVAWKPGTMEIATGSLDKTVQIWDGATGRSLRTIKDHADPVFSIAYSPNGKLLATASGDRTAKLFDTSTWKRTDTLNAHQDAVTHVAFNATGTLIATTGADRQMRVWKVEPGKIENPLRSQGDGDTINTCAFSPDGNLLVWGASNSSVKLFNGDGSNHKRDIKDAKDWVYAVAIGADNDTIVAGTQEGKVYFWSAKSGKLRVTVALEPAGAKIETVSEARK